MSPAHRRFLLLEQGVGSVVVNLLISALIAVVAYRGATVVPLWGEQSIASDTLGTTFSLPLFTCVIVTTLARRRVRAGRLAPWTGARWGLRRLPDRPFWRGLVLGLLASVLVAPPTLVVLSMLGVAQQSFWGFVAFKALFAAALGAVVTPLIALWAIVADASWHDVGVRA